MADSASLERGYRRLLAYYPRAFRRENEEEILAVLMACAGGAHLRPGVQPVLPAAGRPGGPSGRVTRPDRGRNGRDDRPFLHAEQVLDGRAATT